MLQPFIKRVNRNGVLVLTLNHPPVNALSPGVPEALIEAVEAANADDSVQAVVIIGGGRGFIAGADLRALDGPEEAIPDLPALIDALEASEKPLVAALHGSALGGGLEVALACHYRVVLSGAKLGFPEVKLGLLPGAGGTQRLTRTVGVERALEMMLKGEAIGAARAQELGLVDEIIQAELQSDLLGGAFAYAERIANRRPLPRLSEKRAEPNPAAIAAAQADLAKRAKNLLSPHYIVELVQAATQVSFGEGTRLERARFLEARRSPQSRALRHAFFAERAAAKVRGVSKGQAQEVRRVGVVGAGTMGAGIAMSFLNAGLPVTLTETTQEALERGLGVIANTYRASVQKGRIRPDEAQARLALLTPSLEMDALKDAELIIEAVFEKMVVKKEVFARLDALAAPATLVATNTSTLDVNEIASSTSRPERVLGLHFFSPANVMKLVEIVRGAKTSGEVLGAALALVKRIGKVGVVVGVCDGFVGNRMIHAYSREAQRLLLEGANPEEVDAAMHAFGLPMGPFEMSDLAGLDIGYAIRLHRAEVAGSSKPDGILDRLVEGGRKGQKTSAGVYDYPEGRTPVPSLEVTGLIGAYRAEQRVTPRRVSQDEITKRLVYTLVNEGAQILDEGVAERAGDIDVIYLYGYGFPAFRGGPMYYVDTVGLKDVVAEIRVFGWTPSLLLERLAEENKTFSDYDRERAGRGGG